MTDSDRLADEDAELRPRASRRAVEKALALQINGDLEAAVSAYRAILIVDPDHIPALNNLGVALRRLGRVAESEAMLRIAIERAPEEASLHLSLGRTLLDWGDRALAKAEMQRAGALDPDLTAAHLALGEINLDDGALEEAARAFRAVLAQSPGQARAAEGLGRCLVGMGDAPGAATVYAQARMAVRNAGRPPGEEAATLSSRLSRLHLLAGDHAAGFRDFTGDRPPPDPDLLEAPVWEGADLAGRRLAVWLDCGYSESFALAPILQSIRGGPLTLVAPPDLLEILSATHCFDRVTDRIDMAGADRPDCQAQISLIPRLIGADPEHPPLSGHLAAPFFRADPSRLALWRERVPKDAFPIGVVWDGGSDPTGVDRTIPLQAFAPLVEIPGVTLVGLQKGDARRAIESCGFEIADWGRDLDAETGAFVDTAAALSVLPLTIAVDSATAHLACGLDRPTWVALAGCPTWPWGLDDDRHGAFGSPWRPRARLYRCAGAEPWRNLFTPIARDVTAMLDHLSGALT